MGPVCTRTAPDHLLHTARMLQRVPAYDFASVGVSAAELSPKISRTQWIALLGPQGSSSPSALDHPQRDEHLVPLPLLVDVPFADAAFVRLRAGVVSFLLKWRDAWRKSRSVVPCFEAILPQHIDNLLQRPRFCQIQSSDQRSAGCPKLFGRTCRSEDR